MAKEIIIKCDRCGDVIEGRPYKVLVCRKSRNSNDYILARTEFDDLLLCESCAEELLDCIGDFIHQEEEECEL